MRPSLSSHSDRRFVLLVLVLLGLGGVLGCANDNQDTENLEAFGRLYGYLRFFHPSDAAADLDWDSFALLGADRVRIAKNSNELQTILQDLVHPFAPLVQIFPAGDEPPPPARDKAGGVPVAWQHRGVQLSRQTNQIYQSVRTGRRIPNTSGIPNFGTVTQCMPASRVQGRQVRFSGLVRSDVSLPGSGGHLWLRADRPNQQRGFFDNMHDRPVTTKDWQRCEIVGQIEDDTEQICFGCMLIGDGRVWGDDLRLQVKDASMGWQDLPVFNAGFESAKGSRPRGWGYTIEGYEITLDATDPGAEQRSVSIASGRRDGDRLFEQLPAVGATYTGPIGGGLGCRVPVVLSDAEAQQTGDGLAELQAALQNLAQTPPRVTSPTVRQGGVVIAWNVFQHFYPYFDVVDVDWAAALPAFLEAATAAVDERAYVEVLRELVALLGDGHGRVTSLLTNQDAPLNFLADRIEDQVAVVWVPDGSPLQVGDIVVSVDDQDAAGLLRRKMALHSGSPQWQAKSAARSFGAGPRGSTAEVTVRRGDVKHQVNITRDRDWFLNHNSSLPDLDEIEDGIWYVNLDRAEMELIRPRLNDLAAARGVIFDLRGYPRGNHELINHLLSVPDTSQSWMQFPQTVYPDRREVTWQPVGWNLAAREPHIGGKVVFLTDGRAISYAESFLGYVENYGLGEIVGTTTAGANGNVNPFALPGGIRVAWTGMRVVKHDGRQQHLVGVSPTVVLKPTLQALREGRDEYVEKALEIIRSD